MVLFRVLFRAAERVVAERVRRAVPVVVPLNLTRFAVLRRAFETASGILPGPSSSATSGRFPLGHRSHPAREFGRGGLRPRAFELVQVEPLFPERAEDGVAVVERGVRGARRAREPRERPAHLRRARLERGGDGRRRSRRSRRTRTRGGANDRRRRRRRPAAAALAALAAVAAAAALAAVATLVALEDRARRDANAAAAAGGVRNRSPRVVVSGRRAFPSRRAEDALARRRRTTTPRRRGTRNLPRRRGGETFDGRGETPASRPSAARAVPPPPHGGRGFSTLFYRSAPPRRRAA